MSGQLAWAGLGLALLLSSVGITGILTALLILILAVFCAVTTFLLTVFSHGKVDQTVLCARLSVPSHRVGGRSPAQPAIPTYPVLTGSAMIDQPIRDMIGFIVRDHVTAWHSTLSPDPRFDPTHLVNSS